MKTYKSKKTILATKKSKYSTVEVWEPGIKVLEISAV